MSKIKQYLRLSDAARNISKLYEQPHSFCANYKSIEPLEQRSYISYLIINNCPFIFRNTPLLFEHVRLYLSDELDVHNNDIKLIGSAKTGFSISPAPSYGNPFTENSDLDFSIINQSLFEKLKGEFSLWKKLYEEGAVLPTGPEKRYWLSNFDILPKNIYRGFIDTYKIPNRSYFPTNRKANNALSNVTTKLKEYYGIANSKASIRVYKNWDCFFEQLKLNTECVLNKL